MFWVSPGRRVREKSSLVNALVKEFRARSRRVGVIAIDPSSPFSGGAILGDPGPHGGFGR